MKSQNPWGVTVAAVTGLGTPDAISTFADRLGPVLEAFVRIGQIGVAVMTILYIYRKWKSAATRKKNKDSAS